MIDYYWLKSFTETIQLIISIVFAIYTLRKFSPLSLPLKWFLGFLLFKIVSDLFGVINYTDWIAVLLSRPVMVNYRTLMGFFDLGMLACLYNFYSYIFNPEWIGKKNKQDWLLLGFCFLLVPINYYLVIALNDSLLGVFLIVRIIGIVAIAYLLIKGHNQVPHNYFILALLIWNVLWFTEVLFHEALGLISEAFSWTIFIMAELSLTVGIVFYLIQVISKPKIFRITDISEIMLPRLAENIRKKLDKAFIHDKIFKESDLTLEKLADHINVPSKDLTLFLNRILAMNFNQYISKYRIEESEILLRTVSKSKLNIEQIMFESGFNSKSVFNTAFKEKNGCTPSVYRKKFGKSES